MRNFIAAILFFVLHTLGAQSPSVTITPGNDTSLCAGQILQLSSSFTGTGPGTSNYNISNIPFAPLSTAGTSISLGDDAVGGPYNIGFTFCFYNNSYTQFYIGSNGWVSFSPGQPTAYTSAQLPNSAAPVNCIMGPWQDWDPGVGGSIRYQTIGTAPNRILVVSWVSMPLFSLPTFSCPNLGTFQILLYEGTNVIENHITSKPACTIWAGGTATQGIQNASGTIAAVVPGRNSSQWVANNESIRYTPFGTSAGSINWFINGVSAGSNANINAFVTAGSPIRQYVVRVTFGCSNVIVYDTVNVTIGSNNANFTASSPICVGQQASTITYTGTNNTSATYTWNFNGGTVTNGTGGVGQGPHQVTWPTIGNKNVTLTVTTASGCAPGTQTQIVTVADLPNSNFTVTSPVCIGQQSSTITYTGNAPASSNFTWAFDGGTIVSGSGIGPYQISWATAGTKNVTLQVATGTCASGITTQTLVVDALPNASFLFPSQLCQNANGTFTFNGIAAAGSTYGWSFGGGNVVSGTNAGPYVVNWSSTGSKTITLQVTSALGCVSTLFSQNMVVYQIPTTNFTLTPSVCAGSNSIINYTGNASNTATYNWDFGTADIVNGSGQGPYQITWLNAGSQTVSLSVTENGCSSLIPTNQTSIVNPIPTSSFNATSGVCVGQNATINYTGTAPSSATYNWGFDGGTVSSGTGQGPYQVNWPASTNRTITLQVTSNGCVSPITSVNVTIFPTPSANFTTSGNACPNTPVTVTYNGTGTGLASYTWNFDGGSATPGAGAGPHNVSFASNGNKTVSLTVSENGCQSQPFNQSFLIYQIPSSTFSTISPVCENANSTIVYSGTAGPTASFTWNFNGGNIQTGSNAGPYTVNWSNAGTQTLSLVVQENGCVSTSTSNNIVVNPIPSATFSLLTPVCLNTTSSVQYTGSAPLSATFIWDFGNGTPNSNSGPGPISISYPNPGNQDIKLTVSSLGCTSPQLTQSVLVNPLPIVDAGIDKQSCSGAPNFLGANPLLGVNYTWSPIIGLTTPTASITSITLSNTSTSTQTYLYTLTANDGNCSNTDNVLFSVTAQPQVSFVVPNGQCFNNNSFAFSPYGTFTESANFIWNFGTFANQETSNIKEPSGIQFTQIGAQPVSVQVNDAGCISNVFTSNVIIYPEPTANFTSLTVEGCQPLRVKFTNQSQSIDPLLYNWSFGNGASSQSIEPEYTYQNDGLFTVNLTISTLNGCSAQIQYPDLINVFQKPTAGFKADRYETTIDEPQLFFSDLSSQADTCLYVLSTGDVINKCNFNYQFLQVGTYTVTQYVENEFGCVDSLIKTIIIKPAYRLYIPNSFSPNFDLLNDEFKIYGEEIAEFNIQIFNRFGQKVYESYDINSGWDGTARLSEKLSPSGVYTYLINARSFDGEDFRYVNTVHLIR